MSTNTTAKFVVDIRGTSGYTWGRMKRIWVKPADAISDMKRRAEWISVGVADERYTGPRSHYNYVVARAQQLCNELNAKAAEAAQQAA